MRPVKISFEPHPGAARVRHPRLAGAVLLAAASAVTALAVATGYLSAYALALILAAGGIWNLRRLR